nr:hypothetical protein [uncultured Pseudomonas sp.]
MSDYDIVSQVIGTKMQEAWVDIVRQLATASNPSIFATTSGTQVTIENLAGFFNELGAANLTVSFSPISPGPKRETSKNTSIEIAPELKQHISSSGASILGFNGTITVGATFGF